MRLSKGFNNVEMAMYGGKKLRIPRNLYDEKIKTQKRFDVSTTAYCFLKLYCKIIKIKVLYVSYTDNEDRL